MIFSIFEYHVSLSLGWVNLFNYTNKNHGCFMAVWDQKIGFPLNYLHLGGADSCQTRLSLNPLLFIFDFVSIYWTLSFFTRKSKN